MKKMVKYTFSEYVQCLDKAGLLVSADVSGKGTLVTDNPGTQDPEISGLTYNSKAVSEGTLFICKGAAFKEDYLKEAAEQKAAAYVSEKKYNVDLPCILVTDIRKAMPYLADMYFCRPWEDLNLVGITGTKGKTTTVYYIKAIIDDYMVATGGKESAELSSSDVYDGVVKSISHITTPECVELMEHFRHAVDSDIRYLEMEVSSQGLKYDRVDGILFDVGIFLNISEDHISPIEHPDFEDYLESKLRLFAQSKTACVNLGADHLDRILEAAKASPRLITFGTDEKADLRAYRIRKEGTDTVFQVVCDRFDQEFVLEMPGLFNVENALAAIAAAYALEIPVEYMVSGLKRARAKGRMEMYHSKDDKIAAIVDFAHNKLSFEKLFASAMEEYEGRRIISIFGCPGQKAYVRRQGMGEIAGKYSDMVYIVPDDPGNEPFEKIAGEIAGYVQAQGCPYEIMEDRAQAIKKAVLEVKEPTVILIAGKGNETTQKVGNTYVSYLSDMAYAKKYIEEYDSIHGGE